MVIKVLCTKYFDLKQFILHNNFHTFNSAVPPTGTTPSFGEITNPGIGRVSITWIERKQDKIISHQKQDNICNKSSSSLRGKRKIVRGRERGRGSNPLAFFPFSLYPFWHLLHSLQFKPRGKSSHKQSFQLFYVLVMMRILFNPHEVDSSR